MSYGRYQREIGSGQKDEAMAVVAFADQKNVLLEAARFALSVIKANHRWGASSWRLII